MTPLRLALRQRPAQRIDMAGLTPDKLNGMGPGAIAELPLWVGNRARTVADIFDVTGEDDATMTIGGDCDRLDHIGAGMRQGAITIEGDAGHYLGREMQGGQIEVRGNTGDCTAARLGGGEIRIGGNTGDYLGTAITGEHQGMAGGIVMVKGHAGDRVGDRLRRGTILIEGNTGTHCGARMIAGTIVVLGRTGEHIGYAMQRGTILLSNTPPELPPTFNDAGFHDHGFLVLLLSSLKDLDERFAFDPARKRVHRYVGDLANDGKGEVLVWGDDTNTHCP